MGLMTFDPVLRIYHIIRQCKNQRDEDKHSVEDMIFFECVFLALF